jgi:uncharacterized membrane protein YcaP (DUF421 family)
MLDLLVPEVSVVEKIVRSAVIYLFLLLAFRFSGKRQIGQLTPFDLVVLLVISNVLQNAIIGPDNSVGGGLIGAVVILALNALVVEVTFRSKRARRVLEASPTVLIHNGRVLHESLNRERITLEDLHAAMRRAGILDVSHVRVAVLEENGGISVIPHPAPGPTATTF